MSEYQIQTGSGSSAKYCGPSRTLLITQGSASRQRGTRPDAVHFWQVNEAGTDGLISGKLSVKHSSSGSYIRSWLDCPRQASMALCECERITAVPPKSSHHASTRPLATTVPEAPNATINC